MRPRSGGAAFEFGDLLRREFVIKFFAEMLENFTLLFKWKFFNLLQNLHRTHGTKFNRR